MQPREVVDRLISTDEELRRLHAELADVAVGDPGHDVFHALRVAAWTLQLGGEEVDAREAVAAALLHDAVNVPKDSPQRARASEMSGDFARRRLAGTSFEQAAIDRIVEAIVDHSFSRGATPRSPLGSALQDADRLESLGAIGLMRCVSVNTQMQGAFFHPEDPFAASRELDDRRFFVDHFFAKLLRLPETMCTETGRQEARRRAEFLRAFLTQLAEELSQPLPAGR